MIANRRIMIANDHAGYQLKSHIVDYLLKQGHQVEDLGSGKDRANYPEYSQVLSRKISENNDLIGILVCGSGVGISIAANKIKGVRAAICRHPIEARIAREKNYANVIAIGERVVGVSLAEAIIDAFLSSTPSSEAEKKLESFKYVEGLELSY